MIESTFAEINYLKMQQIVAIETYNKFSIVWLRKKCLIVCSCRSTKTLKIRFNINKFICYTHYEHVMRIYTRSIAAVEYSIIKL